MKSLIKNIASAFAMIIVPTLASADNHLTDNQSIDVEYYNVWEVLPTTSMGTASDEDTALQLYLVDSNDIQAMSQPFVVNNNSAIDLESLKNVLPSLMDEDGVVSIDVNELIKYIRK